jgi:uncharacterized protein YaaN involved in tellurite resistance
MDNNQTKTLEKEATKILSVGEIKKELAIGSPNEIQLTPTDEKSMDAKADEFVAQLLNFDPSNTDEQEARKSSVEQMAYDVQKRAAKQSELLRQPVRKMTEKSDDKGDVANALINLKVKVEELDPGKFDFEDGWISRTLGRLPGVGTPIKRYFSKFESAQTVIGAITRSLENGRDQLQRDNTTLVEDQKQMRESSKKLEQAVRLGQLMDQKIQYKLDREIPKEDPKHKFVSEELLFPLRQRIIDLQQQLAVCQQGIIATEIIMRNNKELVRGVNRALNVTVSALETAATVAMALANQKIVLDKVTSVSQTTSDLIAGTSARLKTQGVEIQKQASSAQLNLDSLKSAFADLKTAMEDVSTFRVNALPQMANTILELDKISADAEKTIAKMEEGNKARPQIKIEV